MLWRRASLLALCLGAGGVFGQAQEAPASNAGQLVQEAFERNREILAARQRVEEARGLLRQAGIRPVPSVEMSAGSGRPLGTKGEEEYTVGYFHPIETGGKGFTNAAAMPLRRSAAPQRGCVERGIRKR